jgi:hypothetical protein
MGDVIVFAANKLAFLGENTGATSAPDIQHGMSTVHTGTSGRCERFAIGLLQPGKEKVNRKRKYESSAAVNSKRKNKQTKM